MNGKRWHRSWIIGVLIGLAAILPLGSGEAREKPLVIAQQVDVTSFDPTSSSYGPNMNFYWNIYDCLVTWDEKDPTQLVPQLATSWQNIKPDTWQLKLRKGVTFTNGEPFSAQTAKWNIEWLITPGKHVVGGSYATISRVEVVDDYTINIITKKPDPLLPKRLGSYGGQMVPMEYVKKEGREGLGKKPVGSGPYILKEWVKDDHVTLVRNEKYWGKKGEFQEIIFKPAPDNATRLNMLLTGEADIIISVLPDQIEQIQKGKNCRLEKTLSGIIYDYSFNCYLGPLKDKRVRQACNYAVDKEAILNKLWRGYGFQINGMLTKYDFGYSPAQKPYPYDPAKAKELIQQAGFKPGEISFDVLATADHKELTEIVCAYLNDVGINARPRMIEGAERARLIKDARVWKEPGALLVRPGSTLFDADGILWRMRHPDGLVGTYWEGSQPGKPWGFYEMMEKARFSFDQEERRKIYEKANEICREEAIVLFLFQYEILDGVSNRIDYQSDVLGRIYVNRIKMRK